MQELQVSFACHVCYSSHVARSPLHRVQQQSAPKSGSTWRVVPTGVGGGRTAQRAAFSMMACW
jgi:hypothetical protein